MNRPAQMMTIALAAVAAIFALTVFSNPAQGTRSAVLEPSEIGSVDSFALIDLGIMTEEYQSVRDEYSAEGDLVLGPLYQNDAAYKNQLNSMDPNDPASGQVFQQYQANLNQLQEATQQINSGYQQLIAQQIADLYKVVYAATNEVAAENGYKYVFSTRADSDLIQTDSIQGVTQEILARPLVTPPEATDLTELVRVKLGLPTEEEIEAAQKAKAEAMAEQLAAEAAEQAAEDAVDETSDETDPESTDSP